MARIKTGCWIAFCLFLGGCGLVLFPWNLHREHLFLTQEAKCPPYDASAGLQGSWGSKGGASVFGSPYDPFFFVTAREFVPGQVTLLSYELFRADANRRIFSLKKPRKLPLQKSRMDGTGQAFFALPKRSLEHVPHVVSASFRVDAEGRTSTHHVRMILFPAFKEYRTGLLPSA